MPYAAELAAQDVNDAGGIPLAASEFFERDRVDMVPLIARLMAKQAREMGFKGLFIRSGGPATEEIVNVAGPRARSWKIPL
ncbi:hypothetical protein [Pollutimonas bauzanensis]|uniref:Branched-chain amino acid transport system substrate-binding protein n=1 Tax=Pollutimonas bauzanensis TaxID=658167 RepID=A0A1M5SI96_9BURK|nr:hypothetical protein [Pollutimonas bauzanensis]SHH37998.1 branched-chain amino acid transport system substrate-binding protein [Pollutimonas bauzanensis]